MGLILFGCRGDVERLIYVVFFIVATRKFHAKMQRQPAIIMLKAGFSDAAA